MKGARIIIFILCFLIISPVFAQEVIKLDSAEISVQTLTPLGDFADYSGQSYGAGGQLNISFPTLAETIAFVSIDGMYGSSHTEWVVNFISIPVFFGGAYKFGLSEKISLVPELGIGFISHLVNGDIDRDGSDAVDSYLDTALRFGLKGEFAVNNRLGLFVKPLWILFLEEGNNGSLLGAQLGAAIKF